MKHPPSTAHPYSKEHATPNEVSEFRHHHHRHYYYHYYYATTPLTTIDPQTMPEKTSHQKALWLT
jgi:hypothetical protein